MIRVIGVLLALLVASFAGAQTSYPPADGKMCRQVYASNGTVTVGGNSAARSTMLPPAIGSGSMTVPAGAMPPGGSLHVVGSGVISASTVGSPTFTFTPWVTPAGGSKTDLPGFSAAPLIGVVGMTWLDVQITQTATGVDTGGVVSYAQINSANNYPNPVNNAGTVVASDWTVARTFGFDGQWSIASNPNYVTPQQITVYLCPPGA